MKAKPFVLSATSVIGDSVVNGADENLGKIEEIMLDLDDGRIAYAVLSFGGFLGIGDKFFAVPWSSLELDHENERFVLNLPKDRLENAPGFDKSHWPNLADRTLGEQIHTHYGAHPYWR